MSEPAIELGSTVWSKVRHHLGGAAWGAIIVGDGVTEAGEPYYLGLVEDADVLYLRKKRGVAAMGPGRCFVRLRRIYEADVDLDFVEAPSWARMIGAGGKALTSAGDTKPLQTAGVELARLALELIEAAGELHKQRPSRWEQAA